jgi:hypothetical protein
MVDRVVLPYHREWLLPAAPEPKEIRCVAGAGHLQIFDDAVWRDKLVRYFRQSLTAGSMTMDGK